MLTIVAGIIMLGVLVFIHELGHFVVAKLNDVKVLKFSLGFGPRLFSKTWGETEYLICAVPLGGYVQMLGEGRGEEDEETPLSDEEKRRSFAHKSVGRRTAIVAAGPIMNLILPFLILPIAYMVGVNLPAFIDQKACIGYVVADTDGYSSGFQSGDCIVAIGEDSIENWSDANKSLIGYAGSPLEFTVQRDNSVVSLAMTPENGGLEGLQSLGLLPYQAAVVGSLAPGLPAKAAGILPGDLILAINDAPVHSWYDLKKLIQQGAGGELTFQIERDGKQIALQFAPIKNEKEGEFLIGISPEQSVVFKRFGPVDAFKYGAEKTTDLIELTLVFIQKLFSGNVSAKNIGGPIMVVQIAGQAAQTDISSILMVLAFLSIQLGILNLLPIPILDGGHLLFNFAEFIFRRPLSFRIREAAQQVGLVMLLMLMVLAFYNDIVRLFIGGQ